MTKSVVKAKKPAIDIDGAVKYKKEYDQLQSITGDINTQIVEAGKLVCFLLDNDPTARDEFRTRGIPPLVYNRLEMIGRGKLIPALADRPVFAKLPIDQQNRIVSSKIEVLLDITNGKPQTLMVDLLSTIPALVSQAIAKDHIRTIPEQRQYLAIKDRQQEVTAQQAELPWTIVGRKMLIGDKLFTLNDLTTMVKALKSKLS